MMKLLPAIFISMLLSFTAIGQEDEKEIPESYLYELILSNTSPAQRTAALKQFSAVKQVKSCSYSESKNTFELTTTPILNWEWATVIKEIIIENNLNVTGVKKTNLNKPLPEQPDVTKKSNNTNDYLRKETIKL